MREAEGQGEALGVRVPPAPPAATRGPPPVALPQGEAAPLGLGLPLPLPLALGEVEAEGQVEAEGEREPTGEAEPHWLPLRERLGLLLLLGLRRAEGVCVGEREKEGEAD